MLSRSPPLERVTNGQEVLEDSLLLRLLPVKVVPCVTVELVCHPLGLVLCHVGVTGCAISLPAREGGHSLVGCQV